MKKQKISKILFSVFAAALMCFSCFQSVITAFAEKQTVYYFSDWKYDFRNTGITKKGYNPITKQNTLLAYSTGYSLKKGFLYFKTEDNKYAYCVQLGVTHYDDLDTTVENLSNYYSGDQLKYMRRATMFAYQSGTGYGYSEKVQVVASQVLIWVISGGYFDNSTTEAKGDELKILQGIIAPTTDDWNNMKACYTKMKEDILSYEDIPSGTSSSTDSSALAKATYTLKYNASTNHWETTISMNSTLSQFSLPSVSGVTFTKSGNNLNVSATSDGIKNLGSAIKLTKVKSKNGNTSFNTCSPFFYLQVIMKASLRLL